MVYISTRTRFASLQRVFAQGRSPLLDFMAQMSVLYEDLRIETFALTANDEEVKRLDYLDARYRVHYFLRRSMVTLLEFRGALLQLSKTREFKEGSVAAFHPDASTAGKANRNLFGIVTDAVKFFEAHHKQLKGLRNAVGGHFGAEAAASATFNVEPDAIGKLEIKFDALRKGGGPKLYFAGELAATAFTRRLPGVKPGAEQIKDAIIMMRDGYAHATRSMHALIILFLWERFA
jgi:hypothetical protein